MHQRVELRFRQRMRSIFRLSQARARSARIRDYFMPLLPSRICEVPADEARRSCDADAHVWDTLQAAGGFVNLIAKAALHFTFGPAMNSAHDEPSAISAADIPEDLATSRFTPPASAAVPDDLATLMVAKPTGSHLQTANEGTSPLGANPAAEVPFIFGRRIAKGGMGAILEASDCKLGRTIAVKVMLSEAGVSEAQKQRFIQEAAVLARLAHPNIVPVYDLGLDAEGELFYTMKLVKGRTLQHILDELRREHPEDLREFTLDRLLTIFRKVCDALAFAHANKIIHRDLKPENIMVGEFGEVLVMDWGIAKLLGSSNDETNPAHSSFDIPHSTFTTPTGPDSITATLDGAVMGTPNYMSPEQSMGRVNEMDARSDIFSLGGILYAILTLRPPVEGNDVREVLAKVATADITAPTTFGTSTGGRQPQAKSNIVAARMIKPLPHLKGGRVPVALSAVAMKALTLDKAQRYQNVAAFSEDIEAYQNGFATSAENAGAWTQALLFIKRHRAASVGAFLVLIVSGTLGTKALLEGRRAEHLLGELRETAPTFAAQSRVLLAEGNIEAALLKIGYATKLVPENADYRTSRANLLQTTERLTEAAEEFRRVLELRPGDGLASSNLSLCERLLKEQNGGVTLPPERLSQLMDALIAQKRDLEASTLAPRLNKSSQMTREMILARLSFYTSQKGWNDSRLIFNTDFLKGGFQLNLEQLQLGDMAALKDLPIKGLTLWNTSISDLTPLQGLPLESLSFGQNPRISDISPLQGMKLRWLNLRDSKIKDLSPLAGMPIESLDLEGSTNVTDFSILRDMPLKQLSLHRCFRVNKLDFLKGHKIEFLTISMTFVNDISFVKGMPLRGLTLPAQVLDCSPLEGNKTLEGLGLPDELVDTRFLSSLKKLQYVDARSVGKTSKERMPVREYLARFGPDLPLVQAVRAALSGQDMKPVPARCIEVDSDGWLKLSLYNVGIKDLSGLSGLAIKHLDISTNPVSDLTPLRGMPLRFLNSADNMCLDVAPLADCPELEELVVAGHYINVYPKNIDELRSLPRLRYLSRRFDSATSHPAQTTEEFWKEYEMSKSRTKTVEEFWKESGLKQAAERK